MCQSYHTVETSRANTEKLARQGDLTLSSGQRRVRQRRVANASRALCSFANLPMLTPLISSAKKRPPPSIQRSPEVGLPNGTRTGSQWAWADGVGVHAPRSALVARCRLKL